MYYQTVCFMFMLVVLSAVFKWFTCQIYFLVFIFQSIFESNANIAIYIYIYRHSIVSSWPPLTCVLFFPSKITGSLAFTKFSLQNQLLKLIFLFTVIYLFNHEREIILSIPA